MTPEQKAKMDLEVGIAAMAAVMSLELCATSGLSVTRTSWVMSMASAMLWNIMAKPESLNKEAYADAVKHAFEGAQIAIDSSPECREAVDSLRNVFKAMDEMSTAITGLEKAMTHPHGEH